MLEKLKNWFKNNWFKILAVLFLVGALAGNPYGYYQFLRWIILGVGTYSAYLAHNSGRKIWMGIFGIIALLFNPIIPFYFQRDTWQFIDIIAAILFLASIFKIKIYERKN
jgi:hypothetical protein